MLELYVSSMESSGKAKTTVRNAKNFIGEFLEIVGKPEQDISVIDIDMYLSELSKRNNSNSTKKTKLAYIKGYFEYLIRRKAVTENPCLQTIKTEKKQVQDISKQDIGSMIKSALRQSERGVDTDSAVIMLTLYTVGCRVSELIDLKHEDILEDSIRLMGKGSKERRVVVPQSTIDCLKQYIQDTKNRSIPVPEEVFEAKRKQFTFNGFASYQDYVSQVKEAEGFIFLTEIGTKRTNVTITAKLKKYAKKQGVDVSSVSPHKWRHSYAMNLLEQDIPIDVISKQLGHESITTTQIYAETKQSRIKSIMSNANFEF